MEFINPGFELNCPACGGRLQYGGSSESVGDEGRGGGALHHYICRSCRECWKFQMDGPMVRDALRAADKR